MKKQRVVAIIQARMESTRLPGKVLAQIQGEPMLGWVVERARLAKSLDDVVVATTQNGTDDEIVKYCHSIGVKIFRGDPLDVLDRYWNAVEEFNAEIVVRITADCPLIDPDLIDETVMALVETESNVDFAATRLPWKRTFPIGLDVEACTHDALGIAWREASERYQREHVMPFIYENPERFNIVLLDADMDYGKMRWTVDTEEDLKFLRQIARRLPDQRSFRWHDVLALVMKDPILMEINAGIVHKTHRDMG
jgi:spore coat polysaccharide biosynthesis protein SpsF